MEKLLTFLLVISFLIGMANFVSAENLFFDEYFKQYEDSYRDEIKKCRKFKTNRERGPCEAKVDAKFTGDPRERGSETYVESHYAVLGYTALKDQLVTLRVLVKKAPSYEMDFDRPHGVLSKQILGSEIFYVEQILAAGELAADCIKMKKTKEELGLTADDLPEACKRYFEEREKARELNLN